MGRTTKYYIFNASPACHVSGVFRMPFVSPPPDPQCITLYIITPPCADLPYAVKYYAITIIQNAYRSDCARDVV